jgi:PAS domain S-box-containing protein
VIELSKYVFKVLHEDEDIILYRGRIEGDHPHVLVLAPALKRPAPKTLKRLEHECSLREQLDPAWAAQPIGISRHWARPVLVLTDPGGMLLNRLLGEPFEPARFLPLAIGIVATVRKLHEQGIVHKDIKPANLLIDCATGRAFLTGFAIASRLPRERQAPDPPEFIAGTLAYMAPEQTGRMNRSIDSRSDLYSLGVMLYEMLTGTLPFVASDPMGWVHCHLAKQPEPPPERVAGIPEIISAIVLKLLAKTAEERYQTAAGLEADLRRCLAEWDSLRRIDPFRLGTHDASDRLLMPEKLYGRDRETQTLLDCFNQVVSTGNPILVLVSGYSGIGKSSIVHELHKAIVQPSAIFISGKFDQHKRDIPYATLAQAFQLLVRQLLGKSDAEVNRWRDLLQEALGPNAQLIVSLIPDLELLIGKQTPVPDISGIDAENRFHTVFRSFLSVFASKEHPLALFLDDLQWLDTATLKVLESLLSHPEVGYLLLIGAFRDNEVGPAHPLTRAVGAMRQTGAIVRDIVLGPLSLSSVTEFVADTLQCEQPTAESLARLVHEKTLGNPFFAIQFLTALREEQLLDFDSHNGIWTWHLERIRAKDYTDNVVDLMAGRLNRLPEQTQGALKQLACLGNEADFATMSLVCAENEEALDACFWDALQAGYVVRLENGYKFLHDRVQEAAYSLIPQENRPSTHLRIGRLLAARTAPEQIDEKIFEIVNQLNLGMQLITEPEERERVAKFNLIAGLRAKNSAAYVSALQYLSTGRKILAEDSRQSEPSVAAGGEQAASCLADREATLGPATTRYELRFALALHSAQCEYLTGAYEVAERRLSYLSAHTADVVDFAAVTATRLDLYTTQDRSDRAVEVCLDYLRSVGIDWSPHPTEVELQQEYEGLWRRIGDRSIESLIDLPPMTEPRWQATMDVLAMFVVPALFTGRNLLFLTVGRMCNLSLEYGNADASCFGYVWLAKLSGTLFGDYEASYRFGKLAFDLVNRRGPLRFKPRVYLGFGAVVGPWVGHMRAGIDLVRRAFDIANETGDLNFAAYSCFNLLVLLFDKGEPLINVQNEGEIALEFVTRAKVGIVVGNISAQLQLVRALIGQTSSLGSFNDAQFSEERFEEQFGSDPRVAFAACRYWICKLEAYFHARDYAAALEASQKVQDLIWTQLPSFHLADYHFYSALACAARSASALDTELQRCKEQLAAHHAQLQIWAKNCPENFESRALLVSAEIARIERRELESEHLYEQAIRSAHENGFIQNEAIACELAAAFYDARGLGRIALTYLREARFCYLRWGAEGKVRQLDQLHPQLREEESPQRPTTTIRTPVEQLDLATVIKASQAISGRIVLDELIDTLMRIAIQQAGAERGLLILQEAGEQQIEAEARSDSDKVALHFHRSALTSFELPVSLLRYVIRTKECVSLSDASAENLFSEDEYFRRKSPRSVLCLPLVKQGELIAILYFENNLAPGVLTPARLATLELIASQAAISLAQARLYAELKQANEQLQAEISERKRAQAALEKTSSELRQSEQRLQDIVDNTTAIIFVKDLDFKYILINCEYERRYQFRREEFIGKTDFELFAPDLAERIRATDLEAIEAGVPIQLEFSVPWAEGVYHFVVVKFLLRDSAGTPYAICGICTDITALKRAEELETKMARERELHAQQRATQLAKANQALRGSLDALAAVPELDRFLGQLMVAIAEQLGAASATLRLHNTETNRWNIKYVFQNGRVMSPGEVGYPEGLGTVSENEVISYAQTVRVYRLTDSSSGFPDDHRRYLLSVGVKTLLAIPLISRDKPIGLLGLRFKEDREFRPEELEIATALATQASLAIQLSKLADAARQSAVLQERNRLAGEIHDSLAQSFTGISMQLGMAQELLADNDAASASLSYLQRADDLARFGLAEARRSTLSLQPEMVQDSGLIEALRMLADRSSIPGKLRCTFASNGVNDEYLPGAVRQQLLRIAQEAISNAVRHARSMTISVTLQFRSRKLSLEVTDDGLGMAKAPESGQGFGLANMRARAKNLGGSLRIRTRPGHGTSIVVSVPLQPDYC